MALEQSDPPAAPTPPVPAAPAVRASDAERRQTTEHLKQACIEGRLSLEEFGERTGRALAARTRAELSALTADLPAPQAASSAAASGTPLASGGRARSAVSLTIALMGETERAGAWRVGEESRVIAVMGSCKLNLRRAAIAAPLTIIRAAVVMGNVSIIVPEGVEVDLEAIAIMGSRKARLSSPFPMPGAPVVRIQGFILMGELTVHDQSREH